MTSILKVDNIKDSANNQAISISGGNMTVAGNTTFTGTVTGAGGMDLLLDSTFTSSGGNVDISSTYINSTYDDYYLLFNLDNDTDNTNLRMRVFVGGSEQTGNIYAYEAALLSGNEYINSNATSSWRLNSHEIGNDSGEGISCQLLFQNTNDTNHSFCYSGFTNFFNTSGNHNSNAIGGTLTRSQNALVVNGIRLFMGGGQCTGDLKLYGVRT